ncbi:WYL domain-containing protein [Paenibacillus sp. CC-CFT747]|nr:WYL domain-containing protein [Paenibacillus sp. CC-CFT747]
MDLDFSPVPNDKEKIGPLRKAMKELRLVRFGYWDNRGAETVRTMEPMGLFLKGYIWYLYGYCRSRSDYRVFRLSRMTNLEVLFEAFVRRDYTLEDVERQFMAKADFARVKAELHFHPSVRTRVRDEFGYDPVTSHPDGSVSVNASYSSLDKAVRSILSYSSLVTVLGPPEVREEVRRHVAELAKLYEV